MKKFLLTCIGLIMIVFMIILILTFIQPILFKRIPSDKDRHLVILDVLNRSKEDKNVLVFGDSRTMFGVDTRVIKEDMNLPFEVFNLSSVGQSLYESSYFYGLIDTNTKAIIQCMNPSFFSSDIMLKLKDDVAFSMFLSGYRINKSTKSLIKDYNEIFDRSEFINYLESRSIIRSYLHINLLRTLFDNETFDRQAKGSSYFPHLYVTNKHPDYPVYEYDCSQYIFTAVPKTQLSLLINIRDFFMKKGIVYVIVLMPVNPDECNECYQDFKKYAKLIKEATNIRVIDLTDLLLESNYFYDAAHANKEGAKIISSQIAKELKEI